MSERTSTPDRTSTSERTTPSGRTTAPERTAPSEGTTAPDRTTASERSSTAGRTTTPDRGGAAGRGASTTGRATTPVRPTAEERLAQLRELVLNARAMPMSASCVVNRGEVLTAIDEVIDHLPEEISDAQRVIDRSSAKVAEGEAERDRLVAEAKDEVERLAREGEIVRKAEELAAQIRADAEREAAELRKETDLFVDSRMAGFESVLHKTSSQVRTARARLAERSNLDPTRSGPAAG